MNLDLLRVLQYGIMYFPVNKVAVDCLALFVQYTHAYIHVFMCDILLGNNVDCYLFSVILDSTFSIFIVHETINASKIIYLASNEKISRVKKTITFIQN